MSKKHSLSVAEKLNLLKDVDSGLRKKDIALKYGIPASTVSTIIKNRDSIVKCNESFGGDRKRRKICKYDDIDEAVLKWVRKIRDMNMPISGPLIKEKAMEFSARLGHNDFQASSGWLDKFKRRHGIKEKIVSGESGSVSIPDNWSTAVLTPLLEEYSADNIFNMDETGIFYKCLPNKTLCFKDDKCFGGKNSKERITVVVCANMSGTEKNKLLVIGKSKHPRCFKGVKSLEVEYEFNTKSWMTSDIFLRWVTEFDRRMLKEKRKVVLFLDNCPAHPASAAKQLSNVKLVFFPPNTTSKLQPMDQGVIKNLKVHYRKQILKRLLAAIENNEPMDKLINLRVCISELAKVWENDIKETTIKNCFIKAGFSAKEVEEETSYQGVVQGLWEELMSSGTINGDVELDEFLEVDEDVLVAEYPTDDDIIDSLSVQTNSMDEIQEEEVIIPKPSKKEVMDSFDVIRRGLNHIENVPDEMFRCLNKCEDFVEKSFSHKKIQKDIRQFFPAV